MKSISTTHHTLSLRTAIACAVCMAVLPSQLQAKDYHLYYLGGQSNMDGYGYVNELPADLNRTFDGIRIFHGNTGNDGEKPDGRGVWSELKPGHGVGFSANFEGNRYSDRVGVELSLAQRLRELHPDRNIALIKYSKGGTSIDCAAAGQFGCWDPDFEKGNGVNQYDHFLATLRNAFAVSDIDGDGETDRLIPAGIVWMQGESDAAYSAEIAWRYRDHLNQLMNLVRAAVRMDDVPVVIGRISDSGQEEDGRVWDHGDAVRAAQAAFVENDSSASLVTSTDEYGYSDKWHYDTAGYIDLGRRFADALVELESR